MRSITLSDSGESYLCDGSDGNRRTFLYFEAVSFVLIARKHWLNNNDGFCAYVYFNMIPVNQILFDVQVA